MSVFILPPSRAALAERLASRATDSAQVIARRLRDAAADMSHYAEFDYVVVNDDFEHAVKTCGASSRATPRTLPATVPRLAPLLAELLAPEPP